jgi:hypothetical protein
MLPFLTVAAVGCMPNRQAICADRVTFFSVTATVSSIRSRFAACATKRRFLFRPMGIIFASA